VLVAGLAIACPTAARMIPRAERGAVALMAGSPTGLDHPTLVAKGQPAWNETFHPTYTVRLIDEVPTRIRPNAPALPAGTVLYGFNLPSGLAFCPPINYRAGIPDVQCLRDIDGDGTFDGGYVTDWPSSHARVLPELLMELVAVHKARYETVEPTGAMSVPGAVIFDGFKHGKPAFRVRVEDQMIDGDDLCEPVAETGVCSVFGVSLRVVPQGSGVLITLVDAASQRGLDIVTTQGPDIPGFPKPRSGQGQ
jgi:hypothetical protein